MAQSFNLGGTVALYLPQWILDRPSMVPEK
jgi:hypothetical protein